MLSPASEKTNQKGSYCRFLFSNLRETTKQDKIHISIYTSITSTIKSKRHEIHMTYFIIDYIVHTSLAMCSAYISSFPIKLLHSTVSSAE